MVYHEPKAGIDYLVDHYAVLGVERDASDAQIGAAFREKIKQWHPDKLHGLAPALLAQAEHQSGILNEAHAVLSNPEARKALG